MDFDFLFLIGAFLFLIDWFDLTNWLERTLDWFRERLKWVISNSFEIYIEWPMIMMSTLMRGLFPIFKDKEGNEKNFTHFLVLKGVASFFIMVFFLANVEPHFVLALGSPFLAVVLWLILYPLLIIVTVIILLLVTTFWFTMDLLNRPKKGTVGSIGALLFLTDVGLRLWSGVAP